MNLEDKNVNQRVCVEGNYLVLSGCTVVKIARVCLTGHVVIIVVLLWSRGWDGMHVILVGSLPPLPLSFSCNCFPYFSKTLVSARVSSHINWLCIYIQRSGAPFKYLTLI